jgi:catechol 2,3-dioxygenase-like lactoylglutathione lyase family enzyme
LRALKFLSYLAVVGFMLAGQVCLAADAATKGLVPPFISAKITVADIARSEAFYTKIIGLKVVARVDLPHASEVVMTQNGDPFEAALVIWAHKVPKEPIVVGNGFREMVFVTYDPYGLVKRIKDAGMEETFPITEMDPSPLKTVSKLVVWHGKDPDGYGVEVLQLKR